MAKSFSEKFDDDTEFMFYRITITNEDGKRQTFDGVSQKYAESVYTELCEQAAEDEVA